VRAKEGARLRDHMQAEARAKAKAELAAREAAEAAAAQAARVDDTFGLQNRSILRYGAWL